MEAEEILARARAGDDVPPGWVVFPLLRKKVLLGIASWLVGIIVGLGLFALIVPIVIPYNYGRGPLTAVLTTLLLVVLLFIGLGSLWSLMIDVRRLMEPAKHVIVITYEDFVKQQGNKIIHVPLASVRYVTARGKPPSEPQQPQENVVRQIAGTGDNAAGFFIGRGLIPSPTRRRQRMRSPSSLAFIDTRSDKEIVVVNDGTYGDPFVIAAALKQYAASVQTVTQQ